MPISVGDSRTSIAVHGDHMAEHQELCQRA